MVAFSSWLTSGEGSKWSTKAIFESPSWLSLHESAHDSLKPPQDSSHLNILGFNGQLCQL